MMQFLASWLPIVAVGIYVCVWWNYMALLSCPSKKYGPSQKLVDNSWSAQCIEASHYWCPGKDTLWHKLIELPFQFAFFHFSFCITKWVFIMEEQKGNLTVITWLELRLWAVWLKEWFLHPVGRPRQEQTRHHPYSYANDHNNTSMNRKIPRYEYVETLLLDWMQIQFLEEAHHMVCCQQGGLDIPVPPFWRQHTRRLVPYPQAPQRFLETVPALPSRPEFWLDRTGYPALL